MNIDISTQYGSLKLKSPIIVGACPLSEQEMLRVSMISSGAGAIVLPSLFAEQFDHKVVSDLDGNPENSNTNGSTIPSSDGLSRTSGSIAPQFVCYDPESYLELIRRATNNCSIPIIASLNGEVSDSSLLEYTRQLESAGASGIELHLRRPTFDGVKGWQELEDNLVSAVEKTLASIEVPLFLKLDRDYIDSNRIADRLLNKVDGMVLFGRAPFVDFELGNLQLTTQWGLTQTGTITESLKAIMQVQSNCPGMSLAGSGGIGNSIDLIKVLLAGANAAMIVSTIYRSGPTVIGTMLKGLKQFMDQHQLQSLNELRSKGKELFSQLDERVEYVRALSSKPDVGNLRDNSPAIASDRWGHPLPPPIKSP